MNPGIFQGMHPSDDVSLFNVKTYLPAQIPSGSQDFESFIWEKPSWAKLIFMMCIGGGGGGGSGRKGAAGTVRQGGGGGGGGGYSEAWYFASDVPQLLNIEVGRGGRGGDMKVTNDSSGFDTGTGGDTIIGLNAQWDDFVTWALCVAQGGGAGFGGSDGTGGEGGNGGRGSIEGGHGASASITGVVSFVEIPFSKTTGGGAGGGITTADALADGGYVYTPEFVWDNQGNEPGTHPSPTDGHHGWQFGIINVQSSYPIYPVPQKGQIVSPNPGVAGSGGASSNTSTPAGHGGRGGLGSGGGGGGAALNTTTPYSGAGGAGGDGMAIIMCWG